MEGMAAGGCCAEELAPPSATAAGQEPPFPPRAPDSTLRTQPTAEHQRIQSQMGLASELPRLWGDVCMWRPSRPGHPGPSHPPASPGNGFHSLNRQSLHRYAYYVGLGARTSIVKTS